MDLLINFKTPLQPSSDVPTLLTLGARTYTIEPLGQEPTALPATAVLARDTYPTPEASPWDAAHQAKQAGGDALGLVAPAANRPADHAKGDTSFFHLLVSLPDVGESVAYSVLFPHPPLDAFQLQMFEMEILQLRPASAELERLLTGPDGAGRSYPELTPAHRHAVLNAIVDAPGASRHLRHFLQANYQVLVQL
jgi:hypothetical protein